MILIAESGSTKTDWVLVNDENQQADVYSKHDVEGYYTFFSIIGSIKC